MRTPSSENDADFGHPGRNEPKVVTFPEVGGIGGVVVRAGSGDEQRPTPPAGGIHRPEAHIVRGFYTGRGSSGPESDPGASP